MKIQLAVSLLSLLSFAPFAQAQESTMPKPGPEHMNLAKAAGVWDAVVEGEGMKPAAPTSRSTRS